MAYDVDQDNDMDILGVSAGLSTIAWFENDGNYPVEWTKHIVDNNFAGARSVDSGDLDGDGDIDLAGAALTSNEITWWRNNGGSPIEWTEFTINSNFTYSHKVHIADIDLDNDPDILGTAYSDGVSWWRNDGGDTITWEEQVVTNFNSAVIAWAVDFNQDTDYDIISSYQGSGRVLLFNNEDNDTIEKYCYGNNPANCANYGGLYKWDEMMQYSTQQGVQGICPPDWHIPMDDEWKILEGAVDRQYRIGNQIWDTYGLRGYDAGTKLKSTSGWNSNGNGTDLYGFSGLSGGVSLQRWLLLLHQPTWLVVDIY